MRTTPRSRTLIYALGYQRTCSLTPIFVRPLLLVAADGRRSFVVVVVVVPHSQAQSNVGLVVVSVAITSVVVRGYRFYFMRSVYSDAVRFIDGVGQ